MMIYFTNEVVVLIFLSENFKNSVTYTIHT